VPITSLSSLNMDDIDIAECDSGACPIRWFQYTKTGYSSSTISVGELLFPNHSLHL
jgi:hypothetical protein